MNETISDEQKISIFKEMARAWHDQEWRTCADLFEVAPEKWSS